MKIQIKSGKYKKGTLYGDGNASKKLSRFKKVIINQNTKKITY